MTIATAPFLGAAMEIARYGVGVVPLFHGLRFPTLAGWPTRASTDPQELEQLFDDARVTGVGMVTGPESGIWTLDIDPAGFARLDELEARHGRLPSTATVKTRRGIHLHFRYPPGARIRCRAPAPLLGRGLDVKGIVGCVAAPPTPHSAGAYDWLRGLDQIADASPWFLARVVDPPPRRAPRRTRTQPANRSRWAAAALRGEVVRVASAPIGSQNMTAFRAACALGQIVGAGDLDEREVEAALLDAAVGAGLDERRARSSVHRGISLGKRSPRLRDGR